MAKPDETGMFGLPGTTPAGVVPQSPSGLPRLLDLELARIHRSPDQPRKHFDPDEMDGLTDSIRRYGLKQPVLVQEGEGGIFHLVAGERRLRAHEALECATIAALVTSGNPDELALIENVQRVDLNALELAEALSRLMGRHGYTQEALGGVIGKSQSYVSHTLRLNTLPDRIKEEYLETGATVSRSVLVEIAWLKNLAEQMALWERVLEGEGTVKEARARKARQPPPEPTALSLFFSTVRLACKQVTDVQPHRERLDERQRAELRRLRDQIDALLA